MNSSKIFRLTQLMCRATTRNASSANLATTPRFAKVKEIQKKMGIEDGILVHLKGGFSDRFFFILTTALVSVGTAGGLHTFYTVLFKK